jgi:beta-lactamase regulating signal transducer with metallopeptidase domain
MTMERLHSWISPDVTHALGWALIHSLWQCLGMAALAALLMALYRRPSFRYLVGVGALALMLVMPVATFFILMKPAVPVQAVLGSSPVPSISAAPATADSSPVAALSSVEIGAVTAITGSPHRPLLPDVLPWLVGAWLFGVTLLSLRLAGGFMLLEHKRRKQSGALSPRILAICEELQLKLGLHRAIRYLQCDWLQAPAVIGWVRPVVFLPVAALTGLSELQLRAVITHELAHIRRRDAYVNLFQILAETLLFYHPAVWWLNKRIRAERELCCDEIAVSLSGSRLEYAQALTLMAEWEKTPFLAMAVNRGPLSERVFHIMGRKSVGAGSRMLGLTGSILLLAAGLFAANALFGIAYPIPAQAKARIKAVMVSGQSAVDRIAREVLQPGEPAAQITVPEQIIEKDETAPPSQSEVAKNARPENPVVPRTDLSRLVPTQTITAPKLLAPNTSPAMPRNDQPASPTNQDALSAPTDPLVRNNAAMPAKVDTTAAGAASNAPRLSTEPALACLLGMGRDDCETIFVGARFNGYDIRGLNKYAAWRLIMFCADEYVHIVVDNCPFGPLQTVQYLGTNVAGGDVYSAQFMHGKKTFVISPPTPDGKIPAFSRYSGPPFWGIMNHSVFDVQAPIFPPRTIYRRAPDQHASNEAPNAATNKPAATSTASGPLPASTNNPTATNAPTTTTQCRNTSVYGRVISPTLVLMQGFTCFAGPDANIDLGTCPLASTQSAHQDECQWDVALNVRLANPADNAEMVTGKVVRLGGDFRITRQGQTGRVSVSNATVLFHDYFWRPTAISCRPAELASLSESMGIKLCVTKAILAELPAKGPALLAAVHAPVEDVNAAWMNAARAGNLDGITCQASESGKVLGSTSRIGVNALAMTCGFNSEWVWLTAPSPPENPVPLMSQNEAMGQSQNRPGP